MAASSRPNILWICTDSQRWDTLGCYGNPFVHSPNLDRLASEGMLFTQCHAQNPLCQPSRGAFLTGRYPATNGLRQNGQCIPETERLVTRILADHDYQCGLAGKLHLSACNRRHLLGDRWWELPRELQVVQGCERRIDDGYIHSEFHWDHAPSPDYRSSAYNQWVQEQGHRIETPLREDATGVHHGMPPHLHQTFWCAEKAIHFMQRYAGSPQPWLFSVNIFDPHFTCDPPDEYLAPYLERLDEIPLPNYQPGELDNKPVWQAKRHRPSPEKKGKAILGGYDTSDLGDPHEHRMLRAGYWAMCDWIDLQVGRMLAALEATGQRERTLVIFTSDHGEMLGDHGLYIKGPFLYDAAIRVPLIVSMPGVIPGGTRRETLVELSDLAPTLLDAAGIPVPGAMQTQSLWPVLTGETESHREDVYCEYANSNPDGGRIFLSMLRTATHKLIVAHGGHGGELYDLLDDPNETHNRWDDPACQAVKMELLLRLADRKAFQADPLPERIGIF